MDSLAQEEEREREAQERREPVRKPPGDFLDIEGMGGARHRQPVGEAKTDLEVEIHPQADEAEIGKNFAFSVTVTNEGTNRANNVNLQLSAEITPAQGAAATRPARYESAKVKAGPGGADKDCTESGRARICEFGMLPPGEKREATVELQLPLGLRPGQLVLTAIAKIGGNDAGNDRKTVRLVPSARAQTDVDLQLTIERSLEIVGPGTRFFHVVKVRNTSDRHDATNIKLQIFHRMVVGNRGGSEPDEGFRATASGTTARCATRKHDTNKEIEHRCELDRIALQGEVRLPIEVVALRDLPAGRWGRIQTKARVRSAENDPLKGDNKALEDTVVIPRLPEIAILSQVPDPSGNPKTMPVRTLSHEQEFIVAARFMDPVVEMYGREIRAQLVVEGSDPVLVSLRFNPDVSYSPRHIYRSERFRLVLPGQATAGQTQGRRAISAPAGTVIRAVYTPPPEPPLEDRLDREGQSWATVLVVGGR
jgi:hypothetical protein